MNGSVRTQLGSLERYGGTRYWKATTLPLEKMTTLEG
jgi:hypothetical protein